MSYLSIKCLRLGEVHHVLGSDAFISEIVEESTSFFERVKVILYKRIGRLPFGKHPDPSTLTYLLPIWGRDLFNSADSATHSENLSEAWEAVTEIAKQITSPKNLVMFLPCYSDYVGHEMVQSF